MKTTGAAWAVGARGDRAIKSLPIGFDSRRRSILLKEALKMKYLLILMMVICSGCATLSGIQRPTQEKLTVADYGERVWLENADPQIDKWLHDNLIDPFSFKIEHVDVEKAWWILAADRSTQYGWRVIKRVNTKNSYGGYIGWTKYNFYFKGQKLQYVQSE